MGALNVRYLGGEAGRRTMWGAGNKRTRNIALGLVFVVGCFLTVLLGPLGLILSVALAIAVFAGTTSTHRGTPWGRYLARHRWRTTHKHGLHVFRPVHDRPAELEAAMEAGTGRSLGDLRKEWNAYRDWPEGAQGMQWLYAKPGAPGVAWHTPVGEDPWLSVVFPLEGQIRGLQGNAVVNHRSEAFGQLQASLASAGSLPKRISMISRVQPVDTARHEAWVASELDQDADEELMRSYKEVSDRLGRGSLMQRHFAVVRWPLSSEFIAVSQRHGLGQRGWLMLMREQIDTVYRQLVAAGVGPGRALSAAQVGAVLRNQQHPAWPIDQAGDIDPQRLWLPSEDAWSFTTVETTTPDGVTEQWLHRTAVVDPLNVEVAPRSPLWLLPLLSHMKRNVVRTIAFHLEGVPQEVARDQAYGDVTADLAEESAARIKGRVDSGEIGVGLRASKARHQDLMPGRGHEGLGWAMHITVSGRSVDELRTACTYMEEATRKAGIRTLTWLDGAQGPAQACTWPLGRGMRPVDESAGQFLTRLAAGRPDKEALT